jgi:hypothetical protein
MHHPILAPLLRTSAALAVAFAPAALRAASIDQSTITQVVKQVNVIEAASKRQKPARTTEVFRVPDVMRTGPDSRAEMVAPDNTVTRVGANSVFSFSPERREINLQRGSVLFNSPTGRGGGTIKTAAATASVLGTTIIVVATKNGGFKLLVLEGKGFARLPNGKSRTINAGQLTFVMPGSTEFGPVINYRLGTQAGQSRLVKGFRQPLPSDQKIQMAIARQEAMIAAGQLAVTNLQVLGDQIGSPSVRQVQTENIDSARGLGGALLTDAIITAPILERERVFTVALPPEIGSIIGSAALGQFSIFAARNITVATPTVDLAEFEGGSIFAFLAFGDFISQQSTHFIGLSTTPLFFVVGGAFDASGEFSTESGGGVNFFTGFVNPLPFTLTNAFLFNHTGDLIISAPSFSSFNSDVFASAGNLDIFTRNGDITIDSTRGNLYSAGTASSHGGTAGQHGSSTSSGSLRLDSANNLSATRTGFAASDITLTAVNDINLQEAFFSLNNGSGKISGGQNVTLNRVFFDPGARNVGISGHTVTLTDVSFPSNSRVTLSSATGQLTANPNTNRPAVPGNVNFIRGVDYGGQPAQNAVSGGSIVIQRR